MNIFKIMQIEWPIPFQSLVTPSVQVCKMSEMQFLPPFSYVTSIHKLHVL